MPAATAPPPLTSSVIGAGILGAATAYHLTCAGHTVMVLERGPVNREGSGTTAGNLHIQAMHARRPGQAVPVDVGRMLPLQVAAGQYWATVQDELGRSVELRQGGGFSVAETDADVAELRRKHALEAAAGLPTELMDGEAARQAFPLLSRSVQLADWCPLDGYANPLLVTGAYLDAAVRHGAGVHAFTPVTGVDPAPGGGYLVPRPARCRWSAAAVVNLAGPWITPVAALSGIALAMNPVAIQMHVTTRIPPVMDCLVQHIGEGLSVKQVSRGPDPGRRRLARAHPGPGRPQQRVGRQPARQSRAGRPDPALRARAAAAAYLGRAAGRHARRNASDR